MLLQFFNKSDRILDNPSLFETLIEPKFLLKLFTSEYIILKLAETVLVNSKQHPYSVLYMFGNQYINYKSFCWYLTFNLFAFTM